MPCILLVDDDEQIRQVLRITLEKAGHSVDTASNGNEAIEQVKQKHYDLMLTDILMPEKEGIETMRELKHIKPELKVFAMSGGGRIAAEKYLESAEVFGALRMFIKPFDRKELLKAIEEELGNG